MSGLLELEPWWRFAAALLVGALIGLEREFIQQQHKSRDFAGIRTFPLIALLGAVAAFISGTHGMLIFTVAYAALIVLLWSNYLVSVYRSKQMGMTTEVAAILTFLLGAMVIWDYAEVAISLGVIIALLLSLKLPLHRIVRRMSADDLRATLEFAIVAAVVLPILPNRTFGPFDVLNPFNIWLLVVFVSGISFSGYILMKVLGHERGIDLTALLGGLVSSTASAMSFSSRSKLNPLLSSMFARAILIASSLMFPRILVLVALVYSPLLPVVAAPLLAMLLASAVTVYLLWRRSHVRHKESQEKVDVSNPLKLSSAITFALVFAIVLVAVKATQQYFGSTGVYVASVVAGVTDMNAITLSTAGLAASGDIGADVAAISIFLAAVTNTLAKAVFACAFGATQMRRSIALGFGFVVLVGVAVAALAL